MAPWLKRMLEERGTLDPDGVSRRARTTFCDGCGAVVVRGLDDARCALVATVDPTPIGAVGEVLARLAGRETYELRWVSSRYELDHRDQFQIAGRPPVGVHACAEHRCAGALPAIAHVGGGPKAGRPAAGRTPDDPPF